MSSRTTPFVAVEAAVLLATASATAQTPSAGELRNLSIPAEPLANALNDLAEQSGLQVMFASELVARLKSPEVRGSLTAAEALQRLLGNTGLRFEFVNPHTIAIMGPERKHSTSGSSPAPAHPPGHDGSTNPSADAPANPGDKMPRRSCFAQLLGLSAACGAALHGGTAWAQDAAAAATAQTPPRSIPWWSPRESAMSRWRKCPRPSRCSPRRTLEAYNIQSFDDYATKTPNISFAYGGGPTGIADARTVAIRGITGQNLFGTAGATGFYIDDTPVPGSIDPRVLDIDNIEVLKGPQGTLFGESSLGGNVRLITKRPNLIQRRHRLHGRGRGDLGRRRRRRGSGFHRQSRAHSRRTGDARGACSAITTRGTSPAPSRPIRPAPASRTRSSTCRAPASAIRARIRASAARSRRSGRSPRISRRAFE